MMFNKTNNLKNDFTTKPFLQMYDLIIGADNYFEIPKNQMKIFLDENKHLVNLRSNSKIYKERTLHLYKLAIELLVGEDGFLIVDAFKQMKHLCDVLKISPVDATKAHNEIFSLYFERKVSASLSNFYMSTKCKLDILKWKKHFKLDVATAKKIQIKVASELYESYAKEFMKHGFLEEEHKHILDRFFNSLGFKITIDDNVLSDISKCELRWYFKNKKLCPINMKDEVPLYPKESVYMDEKMVTLKIEKGKMQKNEDARMILTDRRIIILTSLKTLSIPYHDLKDITFNGEIFVIRNKITNEYVMMKTSTDTDVMLLQILIERMIRESIR